MGHGALHVVYDGEQVAHELLAGELALGQALAGGAAAVVLPVGLQARKAVCGVGGLGLCVLGGLLGVGQLAGEVVALVAQRVGVGLEVVGGRGLLLDLGVLLVDGRVSLGLAHVLVTLDGNPHVVSLRAGGGHVGRRLPVIHVLGRHANHPYSFLSSSTTS